MVKNKKIIFSILIPVIFTILFLFSGIGSAMEITLESQTAHREINGLVRVNFYATGVTDLISMGILVTYQSNILEVISAEKNTDFATGFVMDADGVDDGTPDQHTNPAVVVDSEADPVNDKGTVMMFGGRLIGQITDGLDEPVYLGHIVFKALNIGESEIEVNLAKENPASGETFANFVNIDGSVVYDSTLTPGVKGKICVVSAACSADFNGNNAVDMADFTVMRNIMGRSFPDPDYDIKVDLNGNGAIDMGDFTIIRNEMGRSPCPSCSLGP